MFDKFADSKLRLQILNHLQINPQILQIRKPVLTYIYISYIYRFLDVIRSKYSYRNWVRGSLAQSTAHSLKRTYEPRKHLLVEYRRSMLTVTGYESA